MGGAPAGATASGATSLTPYSLPGIIACMFCMHKLPDTILAKFDWDQNTGCWLWKAALTGGGYGAYRNKLAHRIVYQLLAGSIPEGMVSDHLCRTPRCVNPNHIEIVTQQENVRRGRVAENLPSCRRGHPMSGDNLYLRPGGKRICRACARLAKKRRRSGATRGPSSERTHCPSGHLYDEQNTYLWKGKRFCKACNRDRQRKRNRKLLSKMRENRGRN